ncbi:uncharacterized protein LOC113795928 [Dermatophagoides pteronyssinus]|uniref:uncharacterized protein LOC113795928 n=1 Tax=Dermatophagoides pteronyssinus TaxID=6956 RepID=UPI003F668655
MFDELRFYYQIRRLITDNRYRRLHRYETILIWIEFIRFASYLLFCYTDIRLFQTFAPYDPTIQYIFGDLLYQKTTTTKNPFETHQDILRLITFIMTVGILYIVQSQYVIYFNDYQLIGFQSVYDLTVRNMDVYRKCLLHPYRTDKNWFKHLSFWQIIYEHFRRIRMKIIPYISGEHKLLLILSTLIIHDYSLFIHTISTIAILNFCCLSYIRYLIDKIDNFFIPYRSLNILIILSDSALHFSIAHILIRNSIIYLNMATISQIYLLKRLKFLNQLMFRLAERQCKKYYMNRLDEFLYSQYRQQITYICRMIGNSNGTIWANVILFALFSNLPINIIAIYRVLYTPMNMETLMIHIVFINLQISTIMLTLFPMTKQNKMMHQGKHYLPRIQISLKRSHQYNMKIKTLELYERLTSSKATIWFQYRSDSYY